MKTFIATVVFVVMVFIGGRILAQAYQPFPVSNARWSEKVELVNNFPINTYTGYGWCYTLGDDTLIGTHHYTLLGVQETWDYVDQDFSLFSSHNYGLNPPGQIFGAIRGDGTKKVWFRKFTSNITIAGTCFHIDLLPTDSDILLYDFDLHVCDSLPWTVQYWYGAKQVIAIDSVQYDDGIWRKRFKLWPPAEYWIEGIGSTKGLFGALQYPNFPCLLNCFWHNGQYDIVAPPSIYDLCDSAFSPVGIENVVTAKQSISLSPNPVQNLLTINFHSPSAAATLAVYDALGRKVKSCTLPSHLQRSPSDKTTFELSVAELPAGVYLVAVNSGGAVWGEMVVKE